MTVRPIIFSAPMIKALLDGKKSMTRRILNPQPPAPHSIRFAVGNLLYVREAWCVPDPYDASPARSISKAIPINYLATPEYAGTWGRYRQAIHMPRHLSRLTLEITEVNVERVWDISHEDAVAEGVSSVGDFAATWNSIHGPGAWDANPWVVAVSFNVHQINVDDMIEEINDRRLGD